MIFYDCKTAPSPRRVRIFLAEKSMEPEIVQVDLRNGENLGDEFRQINPDCTVPVLELDDGTRLTEVLAICQYLENLQPEPRMLGHDPKEAALVTMWTTKTEQHGLMALAEHFRNKAKGFAGRALTGPANYEQIPELVARGQQRVEKFLLRLDEQLANQEFVAGDTFSIADITAMVTIDFAAWSKISIAESSDNLTRWYESVSSRPSAAA